MKNLLLKISLFLCGICVGQPMPPIAYNDINPNKFNKSKTELPNKFIRADFNYGFENTLDFHLVKNYDKKLVGLGYSSYIGNDVKGYEIGQGTYTYLNTYEVKDKAYYFMYGYQIKRLSIMGKIGVYTTANYNNYLENGGNPNNVYFAKYGGNMLFQYGGHISWSVSKGAGVGMGYDKFNGFTIGVSAFF